MFEYKGGQYTYEDLRLEAKKQGVEFNDFMGKMKGLGMVYKSNAPEKGLNLDMSSQQPFGQDQLETDDEIGFFEGIGISFQNKPAEAKGYWYKAQLAMAPYIELMGGPDAARAWLGDFSKESMGKTGFLDPETNNVVSFNNEAYDRDGHDADENKRYYELVKLRQSVPRYEENPVKIIDVASGKNIEDKVSEEAQEKFKQSLENQKNIRKISDSEGFLDAVKSGEVGDAIVHGSDFIAQTAMQLALARVTGGTSMMGIMYGDAYTTFNDEKSKLLYGENDPDRFKKLIENDEDQIAIPAALGGLGYLMERAGYKGMMKEMAKRSFTGKTAVGLLATGNKEGLTEYGQGLTERLNLNLGKGMDLEDAVIDVSKYMWTEQAWENYFAGLIGGVGVGGGGKAVNAALRYDETSNQFINEKIKTINGLLELKAKTTNKKKRKNLEDLIQIQEVGLKEYLDNNNKISQYLSGRQKKGLIDLLNQKREARKELQDIFNLHKKGILSNTELDASKSEIDSRIKRYDDGMLKIKNDANMSLLMQDLDASGSLVKDIKNLEQLVYKTPAEFLAAVKAEYLAQGKTEKEFEQATKNVSIDGIKVGNKLLINAKVAAEKNAFGTGTHEILHGILKSTLQADDGSGNLSLKGESIVKDFVSKLSSKQKKLIEERLKSGNYKFNKDKTEKEFKEYGEEYLNFYAQLSKEGKFSLNAIQKAGQWLSSFYRTNSEFKKLGFENGEQTKAFLDAFVTDSKDGIYRKEFTELAKEGVGMEGTSEFSKDSKGPVDDLGKMGWNDKTWKESGATFAIETMKDEKLLDALIYSKYKVEDVPANFVDLVYAELVKDVQKFNEGKWGTKDENNSLFGYLQGRIKFRAGDVYNREFKVDDAMKGAKDIGKTTKEGEVKVQVAAEKSAEMEAFEEEDLSIQGQAKKAKADKQRYSEYRRKLGFETGSKIYNEVLDNVKKSLMMAYGATQNITDAQLRAKAIATKLKKEYANLNSPLFKQIKNFLTYGVADVYVKRGTKDIYISNLKKFREDIVKNTSTADLVQMERNTPEADRIFTNFVKVLTSIEQVQDAVNKEQLPPEALNKITKDKKTGKGAFSPSLYNKIMPTETELISWADQPGINPVTGLRQGLKGTRKDGLAMRMVNGLVTDAIMEARQSEEVQNKIANMDIDPGSVAELGAAIGREVNVKFSKSNAIGDISAAIDGAGDINVYSQIKFSKSHREAYEKQLTKKRPDLTEDQRKNAVQSVFDFVDDKAIPNHLKSKYEKMAMHYTANGFLILPEDGYKVIEAEKIAAQKKLDPFSFKNPNVLIETYVGEVKGTRTNPDNVKTFSNKTQFAGGVTVYNVEDSKQGQKDVRKVIDTHFGEKSNPWCLCARKKVNEYSSELYISSAEANNRQDANKIANKAKKEGNNVVVERSGDKFIITTFAKMEGKDDLNLAFTLWKTYNKDGNGHQIAFQNGRLVAFRDGKKEPRWWDRNDNPTSGVVVRGKKVKDGFKEVIEVNKTKETLLYYEKVLGDKKNGTTTKKDLEGNIYLLETKKNGKLDGKRISFKQAGTIDVGTNDYNSTQTENYKDGRRIDFKEERTYTNKKATVGTSIDREEIRVDNITKYERYFTEDNSSIIETETIIIEGTINQKYFKEFNDPSLADGFTKSNLPYLTPAHERYYGMQGQKVKLKLNLDEKGIDMPRGTTDMASGGYKTVTIDGVVQEPRVKFSKSAENNVKFSLSEAQQDRKILPAILKKQIQVERRILKQATEEDLVLLESLGDFENTITSGLQYKEAYSNFVSNLPPNTAALLVDFKNIEAFEQYVVNIKVPQIRKLGLDAAGVYFKNKFNKLTTTKDKVDLVNKFLTNIGISARGGKGLVKSYTNQQLLEGPVTKIFGKKFVEKHFNLEEVKKGKTVRYSYDGKSYEKVTLYKDVDTIKESRGKTSVVKEVNGEAKEARAFVQEIIDSNISVSERLAIIDLLSLNQRGAIRKMYTFGETVTDKVKKPATELVLEHEITVKNMTKYLRQRIKDILEQKPLEEIMDQAKVHVWDNSIDKVLNAEKTIDGKSLRQEGGRTRYQNPNVNGHLQNKKDKGLITNVPSTIKPVNNLPKAVQFSRSANNPTKGITVLDFDDTLATSKSMIRFTRPDGTKGKLNAEQYASTYEDLSELGYKWDFSEFNKVVDGKTAPLFNKAMKLQGKFGPKNMFVLTARPAESAAAIHAFLKANGLNIPLKNITGLANSTAEAKALWIADKVGEGYNDFYFADDALQNVKAVQSMLDNLNVRSKVQQAKVKFSKSDIKKFKQTTIYKKFENGLKGQKLYHGGNKIVNKIPGVKNEEHLTWFWINDQQGAEAHIEGLVDKDPKNANLPMYKVDFNSIADDHLIFPDFEYIPYTVVKEAVDKVYPDGSGKTRGVKEKYSDYDAVKIMKDPKAMEILEYFLEWSFENNNEYEYFTGIPFHENGKVSEGMPMIVLGAIPSNKRSLVARPKAQVRGLAAKIRGSVKDLKFSKSSLRGNKAVQNMLDQFDVKSKAQQARVKFSKNMNTEFNKVLERTTGVDANEIISGARAAKRGASKGKYKFFVPPSADDFKGLLYYFVGKGKQGEKDMAFLKKALTDPLNRAYTEFNAARQSIANDYRNLKKQMPDVKKKLLQKTPDSDFTYGDAVRVYLWNKAGFDVPGLNQKDVDNLVKMVTSDPQLMIFAYKLGKISKRPEGYTNPTEHWQIGDIRNDLADATGRVGRKEFFTEFIENAEQIFGKMVNGKLTGDNINKIEAIYGSNFREALEDILYSTYTGSSRPYGSNRMVNGFTNWINGSVGATMFVNMRSALLQQMSSVNFLNWGDNNIFKAGKAFANFPQYIKDWAMIFNSDKLKQRRSGLSMDINANELATYLGKSKSKPAALLSWLLQKGFLPTQVSDSIAIANGGAGFYRNRVNTYLKQGFKQKEAEEKAWNDFSEIAEETQQSARPDMVSQQQRSPIGKWFLNFLNTPMQYSRIMKKAMLDLVNRRGDAKTHISRIIYYGAAQNAIFYTLQTGLFAAMFDDDDEETQKFFDTKAQMTANNMVDGLLKGLGFGGAAISTVKNMIIKFIEEDRKGYRGKPAKKVTLEMVNFSPVVGIKVRKISSAIDRYSWDKELVKEMETFDIDNPIWGISTGIIEGATNVPLNRLYRKVQNVRAAADADREAWQRLALVSGWSVWNIGEQNKELEKLKDEIKARKKKSQKSKSKKKKNRFGPRIL